MPGAGSLSREWPSHSAIFLALLAHPSMGNERNCFQRRIGGGSRISKNWESLIMEVAQNVILADDHPVLRSGVRTLLENSGEFRVIREAGDGLELMNLFMSGIIPDVLVLDLTMPNLSGVEVLQQIRGMGSDCKVLVLTMHKEPEFLCRSFMAGADGYLLKDGIAKELLDALRTIVEGKIYLSPGMKAELPDTCNLKHFQGMGMPAGFSHCDFLAFSELKTARPIRANTSTTAD